MNFGVFAAPRRAEHVDYILREDGKFHVDYINREGAQSEKNDCIFKGSHLPKWAKGSEQKFFSTATRYKNKGNVHYREVKSSLPNELSLEQKREIVGRFIAEHLSSHYYTYAIHEKVGKLSGEWHPHVHIMFSERLIDDVEKMSERPTYKYFRRVAKTSKGEQSASFERRRQRDAQEKIALLAASILHKNLKIAHEYETAKKRVGVLYKKLQEAKKHFNFFDEGYRSLKQNRLYRVIQSKHHSIKTDTLKENE